MREAREGAVAEQVVGRVSRRHVLKILVASTAGVALAACASGTGAPPAPASAPAAPAAASGQAPSGPAQPAAAPAAKSLSGQTVKFGVLSNFKGDAIEKTVPDFEKQTGIKVQLDKLPSPNLNDKMAVSFASGNPDYDVGMIDEPWVAGLSPYLLPMDELITRDKVDLKLYVPQAAASGV